MRSFSSWLGVGPGDLKLADLASPEFRGFGEPGARHCHVRYRYYVAQAVLQNRKEDAGSIARVAAPDIEELVVAAIRHEVGNIDQQVAPGQTSPLLELSDRDLVALQVERIVLRSRHIEITLRGGASPEGEGTADPGSLAPSTLRCRASGRKGIAWKPSAQANLDPATSDLLLTAIARARSWMNDLTEGRVNSFEEIARSENIDRLTDLLNAERVRTFGNARQRPGARAKWSRDELGSDRRGVPSHTLEHLVREGCNSVRPSNIGCSIPRHSTVNGLSTSRSKDCTKHPEQLSEKFAIRLGAQEAHAIDCCIAYVRKKFGIKLRVKLPRRPLRKAKSVAKIWRGVGKSVNKKRVAILSIEGFISHWTAVCAVTPKTMRPLSGSGRPISLECIGQPQPTTC